jgi:hypothetical protein
MPSDIANQPEYSPSDLNELISLYEASQLSGFSASHLRLLVSNRELWGKKIGRNWLTTRQAVQEYKNIGHKRGRKPKTQIDT